MTVVPKPGSSMARVAQAAETLGLPIELKTMDQSTRTAGEAAEACGCHVAQIVKSLVFVDVDRQALVLLLVSGRNNADLAHLQAKHGLTLDRADTRRVRDETGFAIGGVAPIGHLAPLPVYMDESLLTFSEVWAAAGRPDSVFRTDPSELARVTDATVLDVCP